MCASWLSLVKSDHPYSKKNMVLGLLTGPWAPLSLKQNWLINQEYRPYLHRGPEPEAVKFFRHTWFLTTTITFQDENSQNCSQYSRCVAELLRNFADQSLRAVGSDLGRGSCGLELGPERFRV